MRLVFFLLILFILVMGPQIWTKRIFARYGARRSDFPGTGGELARHLLDRFNMSHVQVESTPIGDHYDPVGKVVRLTPDHFSGMSLTAATVAAHEVGHAIQDETGYGPLAERTKLIRFAQGAEKAGAIVMMMVPFAAMLTRSPAGGVLMLMAGLATMGVSTLVHLVTLPVEWDASFRRALPLLQQGNYLSPEDMHGAKKNTYRSGLDLCGCVVRQPVEFMAMDSPSSTIN